MSLNFKLLAPLGVILGLDNTDGVPASGLDHLSDGDYGVLFRVKL